MKPRRQNELWGVEWRWIVNGQAEWRLLWGHGIRKDEDGHPLPILFRTRRRAREWIADHYGYIEHRGDLRHMGWVMPRAVKVTVVKEETER